LPPREGERKDERKKKVYEVFCWVKTISDVNHFLGKTDRFSKRFYTVMHEHHQEHDEHWISVQAIAISRDLTYILRWHIPCEEDKEIARLGEDDNASLEHPPHGYMPIDKAFSEKWFPCADHDSYVNVFEYNGFARVNQIKTDWEKTSLGSRW